MENIASNEDLMKIIQVKVEDKKELKQYAKERGFTMSGFLRHLWLKEKNRKQ